MTSIMVTDMPPRWAGRREDGRWRRPLMDYSPPSLLTSLRTLCSRYSGIGWSKLLR